jgi:hypothetical protein
MAEFADVLPVDEDQMPPDGNPHPLPGHILQNLNMFVMPQYPEIGWGMLCSSLSYLCSKVIICMMIRSWMTRRMCKNQ